MGIDLVLIWTILVAFSLMMYIVLDGFDLGIGILFPLIKGKEARDVMMNSVAPVWDGNETWLVLGGAGLFAAFPLAYATLLSALYIPLILMLIGLILRGVSFEFRFKSDGRHRGIWDKTFFIGSYCTAFFQGVALGAFIDGFQMDGHTYIGGSFGWLSTFSVFTGLAVPIAYAMLGSAWLVMKTEGDLQHRMIPLAKWTTIVLFLSIIAISIWTPLTHEAVAQRWFAFPNIIYFSPVPILTVLLTYIVLKLLGSNPHSGPFICALCLLFMGYSGLAISMWPYIIPPSITIWEAAAPAQSMGFTLVGTLFILPIILTYTAWSYFVFKGKVKIGEGYH